MRTDETKPVSSAGATHDNPLLVCGPQQAYAVVAKTTCADGSRPLNGEPRQGRAARSGSMASHQEPESMIVSHIVDRYKVPCSAGARDVYVCHYHCPGESSPALAKLEETLLERRPTAQSAHRTPRGVY